MSAGFTQLSIPLTPQVTLNSVSKECLSEGFNFPTFRLLNKQDRVQLSFKPFNHESNINYNLFVVANSKGWFVSAVVQSDGSYALCCSPLADLRAAFKSATTGDGIFPSKRTVPLHSRKPNLLALACGDTRLFVCFESGELAVYDTSTLFSEGSHSVTPIRSLPAESGQIRCITPNPGVDPNPVDLVAIVYANKTVVLYNSMLEPQGGWVSTSMSVNEVPVAVAWSPKGKHLSIGLQGGDILTYPLTNKNSVHRHIPPTCQSPLIGLNWLYPGHTFRTAYAASSSHDCLHHIVCLDAKAPTATYYSPGYPFPLPDRSFQHFSVILPKWDEDAGSSESKSLLVVGDKASVDLEILGNIGTQWYQQSQENPLSLPLDRNLDDTFLLALDTDLTDTEASAPVIYTYLNDGTVQAWRMEISKPYPGMINTRATSGSVSSSTLSQSPAPTVVASPGTGVLSPKQSGFGFGQPSALGKATAFDQPQSSSPFGASAFGQLAPAGGASTFGQSSPPPFGGTSSSSPFGQPASSSAFSSAFASGSPTNNTFGGGSTMGAFGTFGSQTTTNVFGGGSFGSAAHKASPFGQTGFGFGANPSPPEVSREASMSDSTPSFSGLDLGQPNDESKPEKPGGIFGSFSPTPPSTTASTFGGVLKPATGFGTFSSYPTTQAGTAPTSSATTEQRPAISQGPTLALGTTSQPSFGTSSFGQQPSFGQAAFGQSSFGKPATTVGASTGPSTGGFSAFASVPTSFSAAASSQPLSTPSTGGFGAFASAPTSFAAAAQQAAGAKPPSGTSTTSGGFSAFASSSASPFGSAAGSQISSGSPASGGSGAFGPSTSSTFGTNAAKATSNPPPTGADQQQESLLTFVLDRDNGSTLGSTSSPSVKGSLKDPSPPSAPADLATSPPSSPEATPRLSKGSILSDNDSPPAPPTLKPTTTPASSPFNNAAASGVGAFGNLRTSPSVFKPAVGFGAFGSDKTPVTSPFYKAPTETNNSSPTAFAAALASSSSNTPLATPGNTAFGSSSALGARSAFTPTTTPVPPAKTPSIGGFGAFSGSSSAFGIVDGPKKSFSELLKIGDSDAPDPVKPKVGAIPSPPEEDIIKTKTAFSPAQDAPATFLLDKSGDRKEEQKERPPIAPGGKESEAKKSQEKIPEEPSFGNLSLLSDTSSFAEIEREETDDGVQSGSEDGDGDNRAESDKEASLSSEGGEDEESSPSDSEESSRLSDVPEEDEEEEPEEEREEAAAVPSPTATPLPVSRSPSAPPQSEVPKVQVTPSLTLQPVASEVTTTPPGTPIKESAILSRPVSAPASVSPSTPFSLGIGRPSTRPSRSSPLASVPISLAEEDEPSTPPARLPVSPQPRLAPLPASIEVPIKVEESKTSSLTKPPRPKTPPLLSAFGGNKADPNPLTPAIPPTTMVASTPNFSLQRTASESFLLGGPKLQKLEPSPDVFLGKVPTPAPSAGLFGTKTSASVPSMTQPASKIALSTPATLPPFNLSGFSLKSKDPVSETSLSPTVGRGQIPTVNPTAPTFPFGQVQYKMPPGSTLSLGGQLRPQIPSDPSPSSSADKTPTSSLGAPPPLNLSGLSFQGQTPASEVPATLPPFDLSGLDAKGKGMSTSPVGFPALSTPQSGSPASGGSTAALRIPAEAGMQRECAFVVNMMNEDLANLGMIAARHQEQLQVIRARAGGRQRADLFDAKKWSSSSAVLFGQVLVQFEKDLDELNDIRNEQRQNLKQIQNSMLKAGTRKEEISRFNKAKNDKEFSKMLKMRTLGPEHLETQTQLRRNIRAICDRIQKLEDHLQASKKKLSQTKTGRPIFRAPSLDTINRTFRNIDLAVAHQSADIRVLKERLARLESIPKTTSSFRSPLHRDERLPGPTTRQYSYNVTPHVAVTTAAALNAERAAHRLKRALFDLRKEPLLNKTAVMASPAPLSFKTPQKFQSSNHALPSSVGEFKIPAGTSLFSPTTPHQPQGTPTPLPEWNPLQDDVNNSGGTYSPSPGRRGATAGKKHNVIPLPKKTTGGSPTPAPAFNWGPLPKFDYKGNTFAMVEAVKVLPINKNEQAAGR